MLFSYLSSSTCLILLVFLSHLLSLDLHAKNIKNKKSDFKLFSKEEQKAILELEKKVIETEKENKAAAEASFNSSNTEESLVKSPNYLKQSAKKKERQPANLNSVGDLLPLRLPNSLGVEKSSTENISVSAKIRNYFFGGSKEYSEQFLSSLDPLDFRQNFLEFYLSFGYLNYKAKSNYWYRDFETEAPVVKLGVNIWISPFYSIVSKYQASLSASIDSDPSKSNSTELLIESFYIGMQWRQSFSYARSSHNFYYSIGFEQAQLQVPANEPKRIGVEQKSLQLGFASDFSWSEDKHFNISLGLSPVIWVEEESTQISLSSGELKNAFGVDINTQFKWQMNSKHTVFVDAQWGFDKIIYKGDSSLVDPKTNQIVNGVNVQNESWQFSLGHLWSW